MKKKCFNRFSIEFIDPLDDTIVDIVHALTGFDEILTTGKMSFLNLYHATAGFRFQNVKIARLYNADGFLVRISKVARRGL